MNQDEPIILTFGPLTKDLAVKGIESIDSMLGLSASSLSGHPLRSMYEKAIKHQSSSTMTWGPSREFNLLALWGMQLSMVQEWPGFEGLINRVKTEKRTWDAHLQEASLASLYAIAGCKGNFFDLKNEPGPDLEIFSNSLTAIVECKQSRSLTKQENKNRDIWFPLSSKLAYYLENQVPGALVRFFPTEDASLGDETQLFEGLEFSLSECLRELKAKENQNINSAWHKMKSNDGRFQSIVIVTTNPDGLFDQVAGTHPGIEIPSDTEPVSLILDLTISESPQCDGIWYVKIHTTRKWENIEKAIMNRLDKKASQLNRFRNISSEGLNSPGIVWIDHPALKEASHTNLNHLLGRIKGKMAKNINGHFNSVDSVVISQSRLLINKQGQLIIQYQFNFVNNPNTSEKFQEEFPYSSWSWWNKVKSNQLPVKQVFGEEIRLGNVT